MNYQFDIKNFKSFPEFKEKFLSYLPKNYQNENMLDSCWNYEGVIDAHGYGRIYYGDKSYKAHKVSYMIFNGLINHDQIVRHTCDNPKCVNPKHLIIGTMYDNSIDSVKRNRQGHQKLNTEAVKVIKWMLKYKPEKGLAIKLAKLYNVTSANISMIKIGKSWSWIKV